MRDRTNREELAIGKKRIGKKWIRKNENRAAKLRKARAQDANTVFSVATLRRDLVLPDPFLPAGGIPDSFPTDRAFFPICTVS